MKDPLYQTMLLDILDAVFSDPEKLHRLKLENERILSVSDVAILLGGKDAKTVKRWHKERKNGFQMLEGPEGELTTTYGNFKKWYNDTFHQPKPVFTKVR